MRIPLSHAGYNCIRNDRSDLCYRLELRGIIYEKSASIFGRFSGSLLNVRTHERARRDSPDLDAAVDAAVDSARGESIP